MLEVTNSNLADEIRKGKLPGPSERKFDRSAWVSLLNRASDPRDKSLLEAGLIFDDIFCCLRDASRVSELGMSPKIAIQACLAISTHGYLASIARLEEKREQLTASKSIFVPEVLQQKQPTGSGVFTADEIATSLGDGLRHLIGRLVREYNSSASSIVETNFQLTHEQFETIWVEINVAIAYRVAEGFWQDCYGNGFRFRQEASDHLVLSADQPRRDKVKVASTFRRTNSAAQTTLALAIHCQRNIQRKDRARVNPLPAVIKVTGFPRVQHIEIGFRQQAHEKAWFGFVNELLVEDGTLGVFMEEPLPKFNGATLREIIHGWRMIKSLCDVLLSVVAGTTKSHCIDINRSSPSVCVHVLDSMIAKALGISLDRAKNVCNALTFSGARDSDIWAQPLIKLEDDYQIVVACAHAARLTPLADVWLRLGGFPLTDRGPAFEKLCRDRIKDAVRESFISNSCYLHEDSFEFSPLPKVSEQIDVLLIVGDTVVVFEAKCLLWPDDPIQFANYVDTVSGAAEQALRKRDFLATHQHAFIDRIANFGYTFGGKPTFVGAVLLSNEAYSGSEINGISIVDLPIVEQFFSNKIVHLELAREGEKPQHNTEKIFASEEEASIKLQSYLKEPPQTRVFLNALQRRITGFAIPTSSGEKISYESYEVRLNLADAISQFKLQPSQ
jgi:hypothetical protein